MRGGYTYYDIGSINVTGPGSYRTSVKLSDINRQIKPTKPLIITLTYQSQNESGAIAGSYYGYLGFTDFQTFATETFTFDMLGAVFTTYLDVDNDGYIVAIVSLNYQ